MPSSPTAGAQSLKEDFPGAFFISESPIMYYTYVLYSKKYDQIYEGQTDNLTARLERHIQGKVKTFIIWLLL